MRVFWADITIVRKIIIFSCNVAEPEYAYWITEVYQIEVKPIISYRYDLNACPHN